MSAEPGEPVDTSTVIDSEQFRSIFRQHPAGVAVITAQSKGRNVGFPATSVISVSAEPPLVAFSINTTVSSWPAVEAADRLVINFLAEGQQEISTRFATSGIDRFAAGGWHPLPSGEPVIDNCAGWIVGDVISRVPAGSSRLVILQARSAWRGEGRPLVYRDRGYHRLVEYEI
ncbi:flavin reductase family protein [Naumannella halotolerans]|uniref:Flavin reductase (DIM6/NTAB) family NADH-FMN oxidoreductase RutF n=1 Tax=Naumannella halotolerans TaxID=993414 RepID=A0A4V3ENK4_9ACTN|nr:flavin reductase family protein [Naumannella halotolerans]TDT33288.1 flavin reductase (DIM6/NTAB) family NADH-FMN oxidoreductase RutF [Naumannella halotolerans]